MCYGIIELERFTGYFISPDILYRFENGTTDLCLYSEFRIRFEYLMKVSFSKYPQLLS